MPSGLRASMVSRRFMKVTTKRSAPALRGGGVGGAQHLPHDPHALPVLARAPVHARVLAHVQVAVLVLLVDALLVARGDHPAR